MSEVDDLKEKLARVTEQRDGARQSFRLAVEQLASAAESAATLQSFAADCERVLDSWKDEP